MQSSMASSISIGFLTVIEQPAHGLFGGYLLLNAAGRPLEFHCTAPVQPNRAQQILYGPTLESFLYGEQIGATLVEKSGQQPVVVLVDLPPMMHVRQHIKSPAALVGGEHAKLGDGSTIDWIEFQVGGNQVLLPPRLSADQKLIADKLSAIEEIFDLGEPFNRIREAIEEAQRTTTAKAA